jgi:hypothetical protein
MIQGEYCLNEDKETYSATVFELERPSMRRVVHFHKDMLTTEMQAVMYLIDQGVDVLNIDFKE